MGLNVKWAVLHKKYKCNIQAKARLRYLCKAYQRLKWPYTCNVLIYITSGVFINTLVGGWAKWRGAKKVLSYQKGGNQKVFCSKGGGVKKV